MKRTNDQIRDEIQEWLMSDDVFLLDIMEVYKYSEGTTLLSVDEIMRLDKDSLLFQEVFHKNPNKYNLAQLIQYKEDGIYVTNVLSHRNKAAFKNKHECEPFNEEYL